MMEATEGAVTAEEQGQGPERRAAETEGPRERLLQLGSSALSDPELLSLLLAAGSRGTATLSLAQWLLDTSGGLRALTHRDPAELADERGLGLSRAALLSAAAELGRRVQRGHDARPVLDSAQDVCRWVSPMASFARECFRVLALNARRRLLRDILAASGCVDRCMVDVRDALAPAVAVRATYVVLVHNHPSGNPVPSDGDFAVTQRLVDASAVLGLTVLDHLVVAAEGYTSMASMGNLPRPQLDAVGWVASGPPSSRAASGCSLQAQLPPRPRLIMDPESS
jgi:DNA repair protein RadC